MANTSHLPQSFKLRAGSLGILRGKLPTKENEDKIQLYSWDATPNCMEDACPANDYCDRQPSRDPEKYGTKCFIQLSYIKEVVGLITENYEGIPPNIMFRIGTHLIPVYASLCRLKIAEIGVRNVVYETARGNIGIHPIYREIRATINTIEGLWDSLGLENYRKTDGEDGRIIPMPRVDVDMKHGKSDFYSRMMRSKQQDRGSQ